MPYLNWIRDEDLIQAVKSVVQKGIDAKKDAPKNFNKNVVDPFGSLFELTAFGLSDYDAWRAQELNRQAQKTLQNHIGNLHQEILGCVKGWDNLKVGANSGSDLVCKDRKIIAEIKNKHNTLTGGKLITQYKDFEQLILPKVSEYQGFTAYFVTIIPKKPIRYDEEFRPSDKSQGTRCTANPKIRTIDGASFYTLVTGDEHALSDFYRVLPSILEKVMIEDFHQPNFKIPNKEQFTELFNQAFG